ncbi:MAG: hypothetical protein U0805_21065 [Pirellulales bacterium]
MKIKFAGGVVPRKRLTDDEPLPEDGRLPDEEPLKDGEPLKDEEPKDKEPLPEPLTKAQAARLKSLLGSLQKPAATKLAPKARPAAKPTTPAKNRPTSSAPEREPIVIPSLNDLRREFPEADALYFHRCNYTLEAARSEFARYGESSARAPQGRTRALRIPPTYPTLLAAW